MPTEKKWVVDEKGYHVVRVHKSTGSTSSSGDDDAGSSTQTPDDAKEVRLVKGTWLPGDEGFAFNKKCKAQVELEFLKETSRKKLQLKTFVEYDGEDEDLGQVVDAFANDEGIAEAEVMLYYGEKYSNALGEKPDAKCNYKFTATHPKGTGELESELLEMPHKEKNKANFRITLLIDPEDEDSQDDTIRLFSTDDAKTYDTTLTVKDDKVAGDNCLTLEYTDLDENLAYTLEINPGNEGVTYYLFENQKLEELTNV